VKRKPTRRDLLVVVGRLQDLTGEALAKHGNDRNPDGFEQGMLALNEAFQLCIEATAQDPPLKQTGPWAQRNKSAQAEQKWFKQGRRAVQAERQ
jgi:hypothetical protein